MAMFDGPDNVLRSPRRVAPEEDSGKRGLAGNLVDDGHAPFIELDAEIALDPGEGVFLADSENHVVARQDQGFDHRGFLRIGIPFEAVELHAGELAVLYNESLRRVIDNNVDAFLFGIVKLPGRGFEVAARTPRHDLHVLAAETARGAAAIHGGVADADDENLFADGIEMAESDGAEPVDTYMDAVRVVPARQVEIFAAGRAAAYEDRIEIV